ncbi:MAG TPA: MBL fold metallo-hydrolase [Mycobacteriales bacterium]|nr:MBL fold metallo-hydrolase [Mycobacteriales bacterium]
MAEQVTARALLVRADNPGPMTLEGTNSWLLAEPGASRAVAVDPGPDDPAHLTALVAAAGARGREIAVILLTHGHPDHAAGAPRLRELTGAVVLAADPAYGGPLPASHRVDGLQLTTVPTPGHSADSVSFLVVADGVVLTGDHVLGRGTTVVEHPEGRLADYLESLERVRRLHARALLPGHGPVVDDPDAVLDYYVRHRAERLDQIVAAVAAGATTPREIVERVYVDTDRRLHPVAELSVRAGLELLVEQGRCAPLPG